MKKNDFVAKLDSEIMPALREQILQAYDEGYSDGHRDCTLKDYLESHQLKKKDHLIDLGLPSGTIWINPKLHITFARAKELGLQFPSKEQADELLKCKLIMKAGSIYLRGINGKETWLANDTHHFTLWTDESFVNENFNVCGRGLDYTQRYFYERDVYAGDKYYTLFVLPDYVK